MVDDRFSEVYGGRVKGVDLCTLCLWDNTVEKGAEVDAQVLDVLCVCDQCLLYC